MKQEIACIAASGNPEDALNGMADMAAANRQDKRSYWFVTQRGVELTLLLQQSRD